VTFARYPDADRIVGSARALVKLLLTPDNHIDIRHRREAIKLALWNVTEDEAGKYTTRFRSLASMQRGAVLRHDHVHERAKMADALIAEPDRADAILDQAIGCTVTVEEHLKLTRIGNRTGLDGWARYRAAEITVIDPATDQPFVLPDEATGPVG
jgi:hypothetical protein